MINRIYRFIYLISLTIPFLFIFLLILGLLFFNNYSSSTSMQNFLELLAIVTPFAPIGTLFGTLKEDQSTGEKFWILFGTGMLVVLLLILVWGISLGITLA